MKTFSIIESYKVGWDRFKSGWQFVAVSVAVFIFSGSISETLNKLDTPATLPITIPLSIISIWLTVNFIKGTLAVYDKQSVRVDKIFTWDKTSVNETLKYFGLSILLAVALFIFFIPLALMLVSALSGTYGLSIYDLIAGLLIIMVGAYVNTRLMFASWIMLDDNVGVIDSIKASWKMSRGHVLKLLGFYLASLVIMILGLVLLIIPGLIFGGVLIFATTHIYRKLK